MGHAHNTNTTTMAFQRSTLLALLVLVIAAVFAHAQEVDLTSDTTQTVRTEDEMATAVANCALAINCGQCKSSSCGWCGDSDRKGYCENCTEKDCKKPDSCNYKRSMTCCWASAPSSALWWAALSACAAW